MTTMKAVRIHSYDTPDALTYEDAPRPSAGEGEVLIRVHATAVNPFDCAARAGYVAGWYNYTFPLTLGLDVSGVIAEVGPGVTGFALGDEVYARADPSQNGAYAEYIAVAASEVAAKPPSLTHEQAAALPHVGLTSWRALIDAANLSAGQTVLIHGAAGGVGSFSVQLAKSRGANVIGTASDYNLDFLRELGADEVIDYTATRFEDVVKDADVIFDTIGGETQERSWGVLREGGILLSTVQPPSEEKAVEQGVRQAFVGGFPPAGDILKEIADLVEIGHIKPIVSSVFTLEDASKGHELVQAKHVRGKVVLSVAN